ncbi:hypothetical protein [Micromonospora sp. DT227]|uniref:hypothetical protein n=1 Tax=Micromonospora sp. DT227 TaxID=3393433 RepID=UPI003CE97C27
MPSDPNGERLYNPDGWGCATPVTALLTAALALPAILAAALAQRRRNRDRRTLAAPPGAVRSRTRPQEVP